MTNNFDSIVFLNNTSRLSTDAYSFRLDKFINYFSKIGVKTDSIYLKDCLFKTPSLLNPLNIPSLLTQIKNFDIVHAGNTPCAYFMKICQLFINTKYIYDVHGNTVQESLLNFNKYNPLDYYIFFQTSIMEYFARRSDYLIVCSESLKTYYINKGIEESRIEVIKNGVDLSLFKPREYINNDKFVVTYAGRFQKWQGIENLIKAAKTIDQRDIIFKIIGFSESDHKLKRIIKSELGDSVELIDNLPRDKLIEHLSTSNILVIPRNKHPAIEAAFPTKFSEYVAMGIPIIVTDVDETAVYVRKYDCGFVCEPNFKSIASTIVLAKNMPTEKLLQKGINGRKLAIEEFDQELINKQYLNFLRNIFNDGQ